MTKLDDLFPPADLQAEIDTGYVLRKQHPELPLSIYTYSRTCQYDQRWNAITTRCRGLVVNDETGEIVAWCLPKFFNYSQHGQGHPFAPPLPDEKPLEVFEKVDGSLGIVFHHPSPARNWHVASKGSFISEQAQWAQAWLDKAGPDGLLEPGCTYLAEIVYPENRIVVNNGEERTLVLLATYTQEGYERSIDHYAEEWEALGGRVVKSWPTLPMKELVRAAEGNRKLDGSVATGTDAEGWVVRFVGGLRAKVKIAEYSRLHVALTGTNARDVWRFLGAERFAYLGSKSLAQVIGCSAAEAERLAAVEGGALSALLDRVPDEFDKFVRSVQATLEAEAARQFQEAQDEFASVLSWTLAGHPIELGLCGCGCGAKTPLAIPGSRYYPPGTPTRFVPRHSVSAVRMDYDDETGCWLARMVMPNGYAQKQRTTMHRYVYQITKGPVTEGYDLDHLCRVRRCFSPHHLEETTRMENARRGARTRLSVDTVQTIRSKFAAGANVSQVARSLDLPRNTVDMVLRGETWKPDPGIPVSKPLSADFRRRFAQLASKSKQRGLLFRMLDGASIAPDIWKAIRPEPSDPFKNNEEG